jgi:hypothetical protein
MIEVPTVLVLGAGASMPFGFPSGKNLKNEIYETLKNWKDNTLVRQLAPPNVLKNFLERLTYSPEESIDAFLEYEESKNIEFGKKIIAATLLPYEKEKTLFQDFLTSQEKGKEFNWYQYLWNQMNTSFENFEKNKLSVITLNYDRSLEYYLFTALKHKFPGKKTEEYSDKLSSIPIIHIYGKLGYLPWELPKNNELVRIPYNYDWSKSNDDDFDYLYEKIVNAATEIKIVHENEKIKESEKIRELLANNQRIYFLGFGFNPINLKRIIGNLQRDDGEIRGTMYQMPLKAKLEARKIMQNFIPTRLWDWEVTFPDKTIREFLYNHIAL